MGLLSYVIISVSTFRNTCASSHGSRHCTAELIQHKLARTDSHPLTWCGLQHIAPLSHENSMSCDACWLLCCFWALLVVVVFVLRQHCAPSHLHHAVSSKSLTLLLPTAACVATQVQFAVALDNGMSVTPALAWSTWNYFNGNVCHSAFVAVLV